MLTPVLIIRATIFIKKNIIKKINIIAWFIYEIIGILTLIYGNNIDRSFNIIVCIVEILILSLIIIKLIQWLKIKEE
jgi:hypothetical protein